MAAAMDPRQLQRFQLEAKAAACLHHTNIVPVHAVGCERGVHYYAMQFIEGQTLAAIIGELRALDGLDEAATHGAEGRPAKPGQPPGERRAGPGRAVPVPFPPRGGRWPEGPDEGRNGRC